MKKILLSTLLLLVTFAAAYADGVSFVAYAPKSVVVNRRFQIEYEINKKADSDPAMPDVDGLKKLFGPGYSNFSSTEIVNGNITTKHSVKYTYTVVAEKEGEIKIPGAAVMVDGKKIVSNPLTINVLPQDNVQSRQGGGNASSQRGKNGSSEAISGDDLFVVASLNKTKVYEQEAVLLTYKVYVGIEAERINVVIPRPDLQGFNIQDVKVPETRFELERYNDRNYYSRVWSQFLLFPQQSGKLEIPSAVFESVIAVRTQRSLDPFEMMFNGGNSYAELRRDLKSNKVVLNVEPLPAGKPADFSGAVGEFSISSSVNTTRLRSNEEFTLKVTVKGKGNMKMMGTPVVSFPSEFDVYDPIITNNYNLTSKGFAGEKVYEYVVTPRTAGTYELPAARFAYFDTASGSYKTVEATPFTIEVEKGDAPVAQGGGVYVPKEDGKILANDIRHIKLGDSTPATGQGVYGSVTYVMLYIIPLALFGLLVYVNRKRIAANANVARTKNKKANAVAVRRLKNAKQLLLNNMCNEFYDEILKAVWGYLSDKLNIPLSRLNKENIASELAYKGVDDALVAELNDLLAEGEFARYAPGDKGATMDKVYKQAIDVISKMENSIKK